MIKDNRKKKKKEDLLVSIKPPGHFYGENRGVTLSHIALPATNLGWSSCPKMTPT